MSFVGIGDHSIGQQTTVYDAINIIIVSTFSAE